MIQPASEPVELYSLIRSKTMGHTATDDCIYISASIVCSQCIHVSREVSIATLALAHGILSILGRVLVLFVFGMQGQNIAAARGWRLKRLDAGQVSLLKGWNEP